MDEVLEVEFGSDRFADDSYIVRSPQSIAQLRRDPEEKF
jgi:hypothetical protein